MGGGPLIPSRCEPHPVESVFVPDLLLEIGTEELPHADVRSGERQLLDAVVAALAEARLSHGPADSFATPRRLAVLVRQVAEVQAPAVEERRGPAIAQAYLEDGSWAPAAVGFARANQSEPDALVRKTTPQGEYVYLVREIPGAQASQVLPAALASAVDALQFPRAMRWDQTRARFSRAVRWLVSLLDDAVLPVEWAGLVAGRTSRGHRLVAGQVEIPSASAYEPALEAGGVVVRRAKRRHAVRTIADQTASALGGRPVVRDAVLDEVTDLVERPTGVDGRFDSAYLKLPRDVLVTVMEAHLRYFPVENADGELLPGFVAVSNGDAAAADVIRSGNERVLRARLEDARFFYEEDLKTSLSQRTERLAGIVLHSGLGTLKDKVLRVGVLLGTIASWLSLSDQEADVAFAAADVSKSDRTTHLVFEFPELEGKVGREYALLDAELRDVVGDLLPKVGDAIRDHYLPRTPDDDLPSSRAGVALGLADRIDTLVGYLGAGLGPTGSQDPYGLRREAWGVAALSIGCDAGIPLRGAIAAAHEQYVRAGIELPAGPSAGEVYDLIVSRAQALLEREGVPSLLVQAALRSSWSHLPDLAARARALGAMHAAGRLHPLAVSFERCHNLSRGGPYGEVDAGALTHEAEQNLFGQLVAVEEIAGERAAERDYAGVLGTLEPLSTVVDALFEAVRIADDRNRLALIERTAKVFGLVADFSVVPPKLLESA